MAGEKMDIEVAEKQLKSLDHSEQHYFNRQVLSSILGDSRSHTDANCRALATTTMVSRIFLADLHKLLG
jgi:hypothetical protein